MENLAVPIPADASPTPRAIEDSGAHWEASLELELRRGGEACRLARNRHEGPLRVQRPFYPEGPGLPHVYLLHPPGGLVSGDDLRIDVRLREGASALLTTPGAGRVYRARADRRLQRQRNLLVLDNEASCEWLPQETIIYPGARAELETRIELAAGSRYCGWEITALGLPAGGGLFSHGELRQRLTISRHGLPLLVDNLLLDAATRSLYGAAAGMRSLPVSGLFVAGPWGEVDEDLMAALRALRPAGEQPCHWALSHCGEFILGRYLGSCAEQARRLFGAFWGLLRPPLLGRPACPPRIWST